MRCKPQRPALKEHNTRRSTSRACCDLSTSKGLQPRAASTQGAQCLKSFLADQMGLLNVDGLQTRAAGAQGMQGLQAFLAPVLGILNVDALQTQAAGTHGTQ